MKRLIVFASLLLALVVLARAQVPRHSPNFDGLPPGWRRDPLDTRVQQPRPTPAPRALVPQPNNGQRARLVALRNQWEQRQQEADAARERYMAELSTTFAALRLNAKETTVSKNAQGEPVFGRIAAERKPENRLPARLEPKE